MNELESYAIGNHFKKAAQTNGGEYCGPCPLCGGTDRFLIWPSHPKARHGSGRFYCRNLSDAHPCGASKHWTGDGVAWLMDVHHLPFPEAVHAVGGLLADRPKVAPSWALSLAGKSEPQSGARVDRERWRAQAASLVSWAEGQMTEGCPAWRHVIGRGFTPESVRRYRFGYVPGWQHASRRAFGLPPKDGGDDRMNIPPGVLIPGWDEMGKLVKVKIRKLGPIETAPGRPAFKYYNLTGSRQTLCLVSSRFLPAVLVESEFDAALIDQEAGDLVNAVAMSGTSRKLDSEARDVLSAAPLVLDALDTDEGGETNRALVASIAPEMTRLAIPGGYKDPGDAFTAGRSLRDWIADALRIPIEERGRAPAEASTPSLVSPSSSLPGSSPSAPADLREAEAPIREDAHPCGKAVSASSSRPASGRLEDVSLASVPASFYVPPDGEGEDDGQSAAMDWRSEGHGERTSEVSVTAARPSPLSPPSAMASAQMPSSPASGIPAHPVLPSAGMAFSSDAPKSGESDIVKASRAAYFSAPPRIRALLDELADAPGFFALEVDEPSGAVQCVDVRMRPLPSDFIDGHPELAAWCLSTPSKAWHPREVPPWRKP